MHARAGYSDLVSALTNTVLSPDAWRRAAQEHHERVDARTRAHLERRSRGQKHAVEDFIWVYYRHTPGQLRQWHPGPDITLIDAAEHGRMRYYVSQERDGHTFTHVDVPAFLANRGKFVRYVRDLLTATAAHTPSYACFGLHEWAMVYQDADQRRHPAPLRLGAEGTNEVVESLPVNCTHYDAFRFFTPQARPLNRDHPTRETQINHEQPGCLHAGMDLYRYAAALLPAVPSELVIDMFDHAMRARYLDMAASPYDLSNLDITPIRVETASGRAEYVAQQRKLASAATELRTRLIQACEALLHK